MKFSPIPFMGPMVHKILNGIKTQTRRPVKWAPIDKGLNLSSTSLSVGNYCTGVPESGYVLYARNGMGVWDQKTKPIHCPYGQPGDRLWVKEKWKEMDEYASSKFNKSGRPIQPKEPCPVIYAADEPIPQPQAFRFRSSLHMPRWASRIMLAVSGVRVERVRDINFSDLISEGYEYDVKRHGGGGPLLDEFKISWDSIYAARGFGWEKNPWVWVIDFMRVI